MPVCENVIVGYVFTRITHLVTPCCRFICSSLFFVADILIIIVSLNISFTSAEETKVMSDNKGEEQSSFVVRFIMELLSPGGIDSL